MLNAIEKQLEEEKRGAFEVDSDNKAVWCLRKIKHLKEKMDKNSKLAESEKEVVQKEIDEIDDWLEGENKKLESSIEFMKALLYDYAKTLREANPELKTYKLPFGELQFRKRRPKWSYDDEKILEFLRSDYGELIRLKESVDKRELKQKIEVAGGKAVLKDTGEVVP